MFSNEFDFCLKKKRHECYNCKSIYYDVEQYRNVFISIPKNYSLMKDTVIVINVIIIQKTCYNNFEIINYSRYLFVVFDVLSFNELNNYKKDTITYKFNNF